MNRMTNEGRIELESLISEVMKDGEARGIAIGIVDAKGELQYQNFFGYRDAEKKLPIDENTIFGMASVTKSFTSLCILKMQEDGILSLTDPVSKYVPEFTNKNQAEPVLLWHLLCHSGGYFPLPRIVVDKTAKEMGISDSVEEELIYRKDFADEGIKRVAERLDNQTSHTGRPGQRMSYCNDGFGVLSDIVRRYGGYDSFAEYVENKLLKPMGMNRSNLSFIRNSLDDNAAILYSLENGEWRADRDYQNDAFVLHGGGGMKSTLSDMLKYAQMYLNEGITKEGKPLLSRYSLQEMKKPRQVMKPGVYYCYGLETKQLEDRAVYEHGGSLPGVSSNFSFCPQEEVGIVVLCNTMDVSVSAIADAALRAYCGLPVHDKKQVHADRKWTVEEIKELLGSYVSGEGDAFVLEKDGEILKMTVNGKEVSLLAAYPYQGIVRKKYSDIYLTAIRDEEGHVFAARYGSRIFPKMK